MCYGNYGIITYTQDMGTSWKQLNIGDKYNIVKIIEKTVVRNHINLNQLVTDILAYPIETLRVE